MPMYTETIFRISTYLFKHNPLYIFFESNKQSIYTFFTLKKQSQCVKSLNAMAAKAFWLLAEADGQAQCEILEEVSI